MKTINSVIITNVSDLCNWLNAKDRFRIVDLIPVKGIANEDVIRLEYYHVKQES